MGSHIAAGATYVDNVAVLSTCVVTADAVPGRLVAKLQALDAFVALAQQLPGMFGDRLGGPEHPRRLGEQRQGDQEGYRQGTSCSQG